MNNKLLSSNKKNIAWFIAGAIFFIIDRVLKALAIGSTLGEQKIIGDFLKFNFTPNYNIAFSLPLSGIWLNILISLIIIALFYLFFKGRVMEKAALFLIITGAISNLLDRLLYGYVIDYLDTKWFTVFNLADFLILVGTIILAITILKKPQS